MRKSDQRNWRLSVVLKLRHQVQMLLPARWLQRTLSGSSLGGCGAQPAHQPGRSPIGLSFVRTKARSIVTYVSLHPETAPSDSSSVQILNVLRSLKYKFTTALSLDIYAAFATWQSAERR